MMGPGRPANECGNDELVAEFEQTCRGGDYEFAGEYREELLRRLTVNNQVKLIENLEKVIRHELSNFPRNETVVLGGSIAQLLDIAKRNSPSVPTIKLGDKVLITVEGPLKGKTLPVSAHHAHKQLISVIAEDGLWNIGYGGFELLEVVE